MGGCGGFGGGLQAERGRMTTSTSRSSPECTPLDDSDGARSGGEVVLSVVEVVSLRGVSASFGTPESARRKQRGVELEAIWNENYCKIVKIKFFLKHRWAYGGKILIV